jgi:HK97 family phage prohead protease
MKKKPPTTRSAHVRAINESERRISAVASTEDVDSWKTILRAKGWDLSRIESNPVLLFAHDANTRTPVGKCENVRVEGTDLLFDAVFDDTTPFDEEVWQKYRKRVMRAFSVRFEPLEWSVEKINGQDVLVYTRQVLMEISCVPIPSNAGALARNERGGNEVKRSDMMKALREIADGDASDDEKKAAAEMYKSMGGEDGEKKAVEDDKEPKEKNDGENEDKEPESKKPEPERSVKRSVATEDAMVRLAKLEKADQLREVRSFVDAHPDRFTPALREWALEQPIAAVRSFVKRAPKIDLRAPETTTPATRGADSGAAPDISPEDSAKLDRILGIGEKKTAIGFAPNPHGGGQTFRTYSVDELRKMRQERTAGGAK